MEEVSTTTTGEVVGEVVLPKDKKEVVDHSKTMTKARSNAITTKNRVTILSSAIIHDEKETKRLT